MNAPRQIHGGKQELGEHFQRLAVAQQVSQWNLGDPAWADMIVEAYTDPDKAMKRLKEDQES